MAQPVWITTAGSLGSFSSNVQLSVQLRADPVLPAVSVSFKLISGSLPTGLSLSTTGLLFGTPTLVVTDNTSLFTIRVTDNLGNIRDRSFSITVSGVASPSFTTTEGDLFSVLDSKWVEYPIQYSNPYEDNTIAIELTQGSLPPGLEINDKGIIRGYPLPPTDNITLSSVVTYATSTSSEDNTITCTNTAGFRVGRPVTFNDSVIGNLTEGTTYYVRSIVSSTKFTVSATQNGSVYPLTDAVGSSTIILPPTSVGAPTIRTYSFVLTLYSQLGNTQSSFSITVINQNTPVAQGGPGNPPNTRIPTILNTRPLTYNVVNDTYYGYYIVPPPSSSTLTYPPDVNAPMGTYQTDNYFSFKIVGYDFDGNNITYSYSGLPTGFTGDPDTGWITGTPVLSTQGINTYSFSVSVYKTSNPTITTPNFNFQLNVANDLKGVIAWITPSNLGTVFNGTTSTLSVRATSDTTLAYRIVNGTLPPNLTLLSNGEIIGKIADQPTDRLLDVGTTTEFTFEVEAYSPNFSIVNSTKSFTVSVLQEYSQPTDTLYIKAAPSIHDRNILNSLLENETLIPTVALYRPEDQNFGKATSIIYQHAFGIYASDIDEYIQAVTRNHYWRNITLGPLKTAVAKNDNNEVVYEVVYSEIVDNLVNPQGVSVSETVVWPRTINLNLGPWYTSVTNIYTSYDVVLGQEYYTSLSPGYVRSLYPNSLYNMRTRIAQTIGQEYDSRLLPLWMTSQQANGSTLGYTQAWVICYTKPGYAETIKNNINNLWPYTLNEINFKIDRFTVDKSMTYDYDKNIVPPAWTGLPSATPVPNPIDSKDFYVLFPRETILPNEGQQ